MKSDVGKLKKTKRGFMVSLPTKKGTADFAIPEAAVRFRMEDAQDGMEVNVERDDANRITKVTIPGMPEASLPTKPRQESNRPPRPSRGDQRGRSNSQMSRTSVSTFQQDSQPVSVRRQPKASPSVIGFPFTNPYTFLPFRSDKTVNRRDPTPLTADELVTTPENPDRFTGVLELEVTTRSPLLTCHPIAEEDRKQAKDSNSEQAKHRTYRALTIGEDVIVPATGIRGALRTLLTILTGGTLGYMNENAYLVQGRDVPLGPRANGTATKPLNCFLAEVIEPGNDFRSGKIRLGTTRLVRLTDLLTLSKGELPRPPRSKPLWAAFKDGMLTELSNKHSEKTPWKVKLSGKPVGGKKIVDRKREGLFLADGPVIEVPSRLWAEYSGRNQHGDRPELRTGDLVWLEPVDPEANRIDRADQIRSLQWSRWGKRGQPLKDQIPQSVWPDYMQTDGKVDEVTDLFGQVPSNRHSKMNVPAFAARIRPENLVFRDAKTKLHRKVPLAPLAPPHPGCLAFYRDNSNPDEISLNDGLRGYKVYRTTIERGENAPWLFSTQGVYDDQGKLKPEHQNVNKSCDLVPEGICGILRIAFRSLTERELALLIQACDVPWRIGGGKPLGLGLCSVRPVRLLNEDRLPLEVMRWSIGEVEGDFRIDGWKELVSDIQDRVKMWKASQVPVACLRYPRAVERNNFKNSRGGHTWYKRHASPRMVSAKEDGQREPGVTPMYMDGELKRRAEKAGEQFEARQPMISGQVLPYFNPDRPDADLLYGYDAIVSASYQTNDRRNVVTEIEQFDSSKHITTFESSEGNQGKNASFRADQKKRRSQSPNEES